MEGGPPVFGQGFPCPALLVDPTRPLPVRGCHPLWRAVPGASGSSAGAAGLVRVRSSLLAESRLMSFPPASEIFQFAGFAPRGYGFTARYHPRVVGCPIRRSRDQRALAPPPSYSQRATSFSASRCQGIHPMPFSRSLRARCQARLRGSPPARARFPAAEISLCSLRSRAHPCSLRRARAPYGLCADGPPRQRGRDPPARARAPASVSTCATLFTMTKNAGRHGRPARAHPCAPRRPIAVPLLPETARPCARAPVGARGGPGLTRTADLRLIRRAL